MTGEADWGWLLPLLGIAWAVVLVPEGVALLTRERWAARRGTGRRPDVARARTVDEIRARLARERAGQRRADQVMRAVTVVPRQVTVVPRQAPTPGMEDNGPDTEPLHPLSDDDGDDE